MKESYFKRVHAQTPTRMWINNVSRSQADLAIAAGATGCTQNPAYTWKMMEDPQERPYVMEKLAEILKTEPDDTQALVKLQRVLVEGIAQKFMPMYEASHGQCGYVSIQGDPFDETEESIVKYAKFNTANLPNMTAKIPVVPGGIKAIKKLAPERVPINTTEIMTIRQALDIADIYDDVCAKVEKPAPMYYSVITGIFDEYLTKYVQEKGIDVSPDAVWQAGLAVAKKTYAAVKERNSQIRFIGGGARGLHHFTEMVGADCVVTINWKGTADKLIEQTPPWCSALPCPSPSRLLTSCLRRWMSSTGPTMSTASRRRSMRTTAPWFCSAAALRRPGRMPWRRSGSSGPL